MPSPYAAFSLTAPADNSLESVFPALDRADKTLFGGAPSATGGILGTVSPIAGTSGAPSTGWRLNQVNNDDVWLAQNAWGAGAPVVWTRDDTAKAALAFTEEVAGPYFRWTFAAAAANPITWVELMRLSSAGVLSLGATVPLYATGTLASLQSATGAWDEHGTTAADGTGNATGGDYFSASANTSAADKRIAQILAQTQGAQANHRGGQLQFWTKLNNGVLTHAWDMDNLQNFLPFTDATSNIGAPTQGVNRIYLRGTGGVIRYDDNSIMGVTLKKGSGNGTDYTYTGSTTFANIDSGNLDLTVTIPTGWKLYVLVTANCYDTGGVNGVHLAIVDGAAINAVTVCGGVPTNFAYVPLPGVITGDGASHAIHIQWHPSSAGATAHIENGSDTTDGAAAGPIKVVYTLLPSN